MGRYKDQLKICSIFIVMVLFGHQIECYLPLTLSKFNQSCIIITQGSGNLIFMLTFYSIRMLIHGVGIFNISQMFTWNKQRGKDITISSNL